MATVKIIGFEEHGHFSRWVDLIIEAERYQELLDNLGETSVSLSVKKITQNKVSPKTTQETLRKRREGTQEASKFPGGVTLLDIGDGYKAITHEVSGNTLHVGIPENAEGSYMAYHQMGWGVKRRRFLTLPTKTMVKKAIRLLWEEVSGR